MGFRLGGFRVPFGTLKRKLSLSRRLSTTEALRIHSEMRVGHCIACQQRYQIRTGSWRQEAVAVECLLNEAGQMARSQVSPQEGSQAAVIRCQSVFVPWIWKLNICLGTKNQGVLRATQDGPRSGRRPSGEAWQCCMSEGTSPGAQRSILGRAVGRPSTHSMFLSKLAAVPECSTRCPMEIRLSRG